LRLHNGLEALGNSVISFITEKIGAVQGAFYVVNEDEEIEPIIEMKASYAYSKKKYLKGKFRFAEGLIGQAAIEQDTILRTEVPDNYVKIGSGLGESTPLNVVVLPVLFEGQVTAVIELASFRRFSEIHLTFLDQLTESIAIVLNTIAASMRTEELLKQSQSLAEELQTQQRELTETNKRLEQQAQSLRTSEELLKRQQEELQQTNEELEEQAELLALQNKEVERKNRDIEQARGLLEERAEQLALTSKYKSEFLANMSHELRTPLNSLLILARLLSDNTEGNLTQKQVEYTRTIYSAGTDLLGLINDILDLAKIESGTMSVEIEQVLFADLREHLDRTFRQIAQDKKLSFKIDLEVGLPKGLYTDSKRLQQVLKNLLSNAFKFTERGEVKLRVEVAREGWSLEIDSLTSSATVLAFSVSDTGIGISAEKHRVIFEAFQQADGSTSRKYGGTGLGLSISREIANLLGGEIKLTSRPGEGSKFTLYLPQTYQESRIMNDSESGTGKQTPQLPAAISSPLPAPNFHLPIAPFPSPIIADDREDVDPGDRVLLIIEDDVNVARILLDMAREQGFKGLVALRSDIGLAMAREFKPTAIMLDLNLPVMDGWTVLDRLKHDPTTRHIPVHIVSVEEGRQRSLQLGAIAYLQKPVSGEALSKALTDIKGFVERPVKNLLVVEDDETQRLSIVDLIGNHDVSTTAVGSGAEALATLKSGPFDCVVLDLGLPDMTGFELIEQIKKEASLKT
ncbi:MAG: response regulator, partial [Microcoleus sp. T3-bin5]|nr:response regulator [Microcoleus sp. T3-bin5]